MQLLGVYDTTLVDRLARVLDSLGVERGMVVSGTENLDEISTCSPTVICEFERDSYRTYEILPEQFGFERSSKADLVGGTPEENAKITLDILNGQKGPKRNAVLMHAGASFYISRKVDSIEDGVAFAADVIDSGKAFATLNKFIEVSNRPEETSDYS